MDPPDRDDEAARSAAYRSDPGPGPSNKRARETAPCADDFIAIGREFQNRTNRKVGAELSEEQQFRSFYGIGSDVAVKAWEMMHDLNLQPEDASIEHYLWCLFFMKVYPENEKISATVAGGDKGAIDPKTFRKYIWPMIRAIADLEIHVVSSLCFQLLSVKILLT